MSDSLPPDRLGPRIAEVYAVVGPVYRRVLRVVERDEAAMGLSVGVRAVLDLLRSQGPMTVPDMARAQSLSRQFVQRMVNDAVEQRWVRPRPNPAHRRSSLIELTARGRRAIVAVVRREHERMGGIGGDITDADVDATLHVLRHMLEALDPVEAPDLPPAPPPLHRA